MADSMYDPGVNPSRPPEPRPYAAAPAGQVVVAPPRPGLFAVMGKLVAALSLMFVLLLVGFYAGLGTALGGSGHVSASTYQKGEGSEKVVILPVSGMIDGSTVAFIHHAVENILKDQTIKAVVLRVESPGGGATASDEILRELGRLKDRNLPLVASYGDYAASGGYYVSCQADLILAQPTTITGSIGVIAPFVTIERLLNEKLGVTPEVVTSTAATDKDTASMFRKWTERDREAVQQILDTIQRQFVSVVARGRAGKLTREQVAGLATGRAIMADEAVKLKLVDRVGYLDEAIAEARQRGGLQANAPVISFERPTGLFGVGVRASGPGGAGVLEALGGLDIATLRRMAMELSVPQRMLLVQP